MGNCLMEKMTEEVRMMEVNNSNVVREPSKNPIEPLQHIMERRIRVIITVGDEEEEEDEESLEDLDIGVVGDEVDGGISDDDGVDGSVLGASLLSNLVSLEELSSLVLLPLDVGVVVP